MTCPACGFKDIEPGEHRCGRCGRRLDQPANVTYSNEIPTPAPPAVTGPAGGAAAALAPAPQWKHEVAERLEQFRNKRARQQGLFPEEEDTGEAVPPPDPEQKVIGFEEIAVGRIEPIIVDLPKKRPEAPPPEPVRPTETASRVERVESEPASAAPLLPQQSVQASPVAPLALRSISGVLDASVTVIAIWAFLGTFHLLGGALQLNQKALALTGVAGALVAGFYLFVYICYASETPGMQWVGLRVVSHDGETPHAGQRLVRALGALLSAAALGMGYLWALADEEGLTWHDRMSKTLVTRDLRARQHFRLRARL